MSKLPLYLAALFFICASAHANVKISELPDGGEAEPGDVFPIVRSGANYKATFFGAPSGSVGDVQTNGGGGLFGNFSLNTTAGSGSTTNGVLLNNSGVTTALSLGTLNGITNVVTPIDLAASSLYQVSQGLIVDPRMFGAVCNAKEFRNGDNGVPGAVTTVAGSAEISISGYTFTVDDVNLPIAINGGASTGSLGIPTTTIVSINTGTNKATLAATPTVSTTGGYAIFGHDDTLAFRNASLESVKHGGYVIVPDKCLVRELAAADKSTLIGGTPSAGYGYFSTALKPTLYILSTGYADDPTSYGINLDSAYDRTYRSFTIRCTTFPYLGFSNINLAGIGGTHGTGDAGANTGVLLENMTIQNCPVGFGVAYQRTPTGHIFGQSHFTEFAANGWGQRGPQSDWVSIDDVYTGNFTGGMWAGPQGTAGYAATAYRLIGTRFEETGIGFLCDSCIGTHMEGVEFQFNNGPGIILSGPNWQTFTMTGGFLESNALNFKCNSFTGVINGTTLTASAANCGSNNVGIQPGMVITGTGVAADTYVVGTTYSAFAGSGTYTISPSQTVSSTTMVARASTDILINGTGGNNTYASFDNVQFANQTGGVSYNIMGNSANGYNVQFVGGTASDTGNAKTYQTAFSRWLPASQPPRTFSIDTIGLPRIRLGRSDFSINASSALGMQTTSAVPGTILDMLSATTSNNSSVGLPNGTTANRPATPVSGMMRFNTSTSTFEGYDGTIWASIGATIKAPVNVPTRVVTGAGTVTLSTSTDYLVVINKSVGAATTVNLPASPTSNVVFLVKDGKGDAASNNITVTTTDGSTIDGAASSVMATNYQIQGYVWNGTQWNVE